MHSEAFIAQMKEQLEKEQAELSGELGEISESSKAGESHPKHIEYGRDEESNAMEVGDQETNEAVMNATSARLGEIELALQRIEAGTYGMDENGEMIPEARLRANPAASTNVK